MIKIIDFFSYPFCSVFGTNMNHCICFFLTLCFYLFILVRDYLWRKRLCAHQTEWQEPWSTGRLTPFPRGMVQNKSSALWSVGALFIWRWDWGAREFRETARIDAGGGANSRLNSPNVSLRPPERGRINQSCTGNTFFTCARGLHISPARTECPQSWDINNHSG